MAVYMGQFGVPGNTAPTVLFNVPPGPYNITMYNTNATAIYVAFGSSPTAIPNPYTAGATSLGTASAFSLTTNWLSMHSIPTSWSGYQGNRGGYLWGMSTGGTVTAFNYILITQEM